MGELALGMVGQELLQLHGKEKPRARTKISGKGQGENEAVSETCS